MTPSRWKATAIAASTAALVALSFVGMTRAGPTPPSMESQGGRDFRCTVTSVYDGDGPIHCAEGHRIRLQGIAAREMDGTCSAGHPCPGASAVAARDALRRLAMGQVLQCRQVGTSYERIVAYCAREDGRDLSCAMLATGTVIRWDRYDRQRRLAACATGGRSVR